MEKKSLNIKNIIGNKVVKAGGWYTLTNLFLNGISFITIPVFTRLLTTGDYGKVSLYASWLSIFTIFIGLSMSESIRRAKYDYSEVYDEFVSSITFFSLIVFIGFLIIFTVLINFFTSITDLSKLLFYFMIFQSFFGCITNIAMTKYRLEYRYKITSLISIFTAIAGVLLSIFLITQGASDKRYIGKIIGGGVLNIIVGLFFLIFIIKKGKKLICLEYWKFGLVLGIPLIFHGLGLVVNAQFDRIIINKYLGSSVTGIYSFAYQVGMIVQVLFTSIDQAWNPWFFEKFKANEHDKIKERARTMRNLFTVLYASVLLVSPELIRIVADKKYWDGLYIVPWIFMSYYFVFMYALEVNVEYACKRTELIAAGTIFSALINIGLNIVFVPIYGYIASAAATVISYYALFLFHYFITSRVLKRTEYGIAFHMQSTMFVFGITMFFLIFLNSLLFRMIGILIFWGIFYILTVKRQEKRKSID